MSGVATEEADLDGDNTADEVDEIVRRAAQETMATRSEVPAAATEKRRRGTRQRKAGEPADPKLPERTYEEIDAEANAAANELPIPVENVKGLDELCAKYSIGDNPDFRLEVWRNWPKMFPGNRKADGFYDSWQQALTKELLQGEYGGGVYRVVVMGPHPTMPGKSKSYDHVIVELPGEANSERIPRAMQGREMANQEPTPSPIASAQESPALAQAALKIVGDHANREREERHRVEERSATAAASVQNAMAPAMDRAIASESRRADDVIAAERARAEAERGMMREQIESLKEERREMSRRMESMEQSRPSVATELGEVIKLFPKGNDDTAAKMAESMLKDVLQKHATETAAIREQHAQDSAAQRAQAQATLDSLRSAHQQEMQYANERHARDLEAERDSARRKEERNEDRLKMEQEERRRDQDTARKALEDLDTRWKERLENQKVMMDTSWEARHQASITNYEQRVQWLQSEIDRVKGELIDARAKVVENNDPMVAVQKVKELKEAFGAEVAPPSSPGIGMSGAEDSVSWKGMVGDFMEGLGEKAPDLLDRIMGGSQQQQQAQIQPGQRIPTEHGDMIAIAVKPSAQHPQGIALTPADQYEARQRGGAPAQKSSGARMLPQRRQSGGGQRQAQPKRRNVSVVPRLDVGLPKRTPPWEGAQEDDRDDDVDDQEQQEQEQPRERAPAPPQRTSRPQQPQQQQQRQASPSGQQPNAMELQGLRIVAAMVHESVSRAEDPEEFVAKAIAKFPDGVLRMIVGKYSPDEVAAGIAQIEPNSGGATPAGQTFVRQAFLQLREALG